MCKTVVRNVLMPLVARYGQSIGLWQEYFPGHGLEIDDKNFTDFIEASFHEDFNLAGNHCAHMRTAIAKLKRDSNAELNIWIDRRLRQYVKLRTAIRPIDQNHQHGISEEILTIA